MKSKKNINLLLLCLIPSLLMGCQKLDISNLNFKTFKTQPRVSQSQAVSQEEIIEQEISQVLNELKTTSTEFQASINEFNTQLGKLATQETTEESVDFLTPNQKLEKLRATLKKLTKEDKIPENLALTLKTIEQVIQPLENGLQPAKLRQVQEYLGFFPTRKIPARYYGVFGPTTQEEIENFLNARIEELDQQIIQIEEVVANYVESEFNSTERKVALLEKDNQELTTELEQVNEQVNQLSLIIYILLFITVAEPIIWLIYHLINKAKEQVQENNQPDELPDDNLSREDLQFMEDKLHSLAEDVYLHLNNHELKLRDISKENKEKYLPESLTNIDDENQGYFLETDQVSNRKNNGFVGNKY